MSVVSAGDISVLTRFVGGADDDTIVNPAGGLLAPGESTHAVISNSRRFRHWYLSIVAMLLPTNDGFVGLDSLRLPGIPGTYTYYLNGYDAGTDANDELITGGCAPGVPGIPADPTGAAGSGKSGAAGPDSNGTVHVHRDILGDTDAFGGISDLDCAVHRWDNPMAKVVIEVHRYRRWR